MVWALKGAAGGAGVGLLSAWDDASSVLTLKNQSRQNEETPHV